MFTGLIQSVGTIRGREPREGGIRFRVEADMASDLEAGESVSVSGVCQTVTERYAGGFRFESIRTTLARTTLGGFEEGRTVNLERALRAGDRMGGHLVQGHVDGVGEVAARKLRGETVLLGIQMPEEIAALCVPRGSLAVDGVSLTVNRLEGTVAEMAIIPYTWEHTTLGGLSPGDAVNLEADLVGKYVRKLLAPYGPGEPDPEAELDPPRPSSLHNRQG